MFKLRMLLILILFCTSVSAGDWSEEDQQRQLLVTALHIVDWGQTLQIVDNPDYHEQGIIIGKDPSRGRVNSIMSLFLAAHWGIVKTLTGQNRKDFQWVTIAIKGLFITNNKRIGLTVQF